MKDNSIRSAFDDSLNRLPDIDQPGNWPLSDPMIHRDNHRLARISIHDTFHPNLLPDHAFFLPDDKQKKLLPDRKHNTGIKIGQELRNNQWMKLCRF
jgi:hypothetical protein